MQDQELAERIEALKRKIETLEAQLDEQAEPNAAAATAEQATKQQAQPTTTPRRRLTRRERVRPASGKRAGRPLWGGASWW